MNIADYISEGAEPPLLALLLAAIDDHEIMSDQSADIVEQPATYETGSDGLIVQKSAARIRQASPGEIASFRQQSRNAMHALFRYAVYCWIEEFDAGWGALFDTEPGSALIKRYEAQFHTHYRAFLTATSRVASRSDLEEEDAAPFLFFMQGVFMASREEWLRSQPPS